MSGELEMQSSEPTSKLILQIGTATFIRLFFNTARRFVYPFAPALSRGIGVSLTAINSLIAVNQLTGLLGLFFGPFGDKWGFRIMMLTGSGLLAVGMFVVGMFPFYGVVLVGLLLAGIGKSIFDPSIQAFIGCRVPYQRRGLAIGITEMSWAGSSLIVIPWVGVLINRWGWQSPFFIIGIMGFLGWVLLKVLLPMNEQKNKAAKKPVSIVDEWRNMGREPVVLGGLAYSFFTSFANDNLFIVYGIWLENSFGLSIVAIGTATGVIGVAELIGEGLTAAASDWIGLNRSVIIGLTVTILCYMLLPFAGNSTATALSALFFVFLSFEFTIVTSMSLFTEILPGARATMMSGFLAAGSMGRMMGVFSGGIIWQKGGILAVAMVSALLTGMALISMLWGLRSWRPPTL